MENTEQAPAQAPAPAPAQAAPAPAPAPAAPAPEPTAREQADALMKAGIGTKDAVALKPVAVKIVSVRFQVERKDGKKMDTPLVHFEVKHPDSNELISISKVKFERNGKLEVVGTWAALDDDGAFKKSSAVSAVLGFLGCENLEQCYGREIGTAEQSAEVKYLCLKAY